MRPFETVLLLADLLTFFGIAVPLPPAMRWMCQKWLRNFGRSDKWIVCLTTGTVVPAN